MKQLETPIRTVVGPTILMGDGSYFDYLNPHATTLSIEDYAWGLTSSERFSGQTRCRVQSNRRCLYYVSQHVVLLAEQMERDGHTKADCFAGLMHESDEVVFPDIASPAKTFLGSAKPFIKSWGDAINLHLNVPVASHELIKTYDLRMLATEKRDLMPQGSMDDWQVLRNFPPFDFTIIPWPSPEHCVSRFLSTYERLTP
jgi:uncharacterized protein